MEHVALVIMVAELAKATRSVVFRQFVAAGHAGSQKNRNLRVLTRNRQTQTFCRAHKEEYQGFIWVITAIQQQFVQTSRMTSFSPHVVCSSAWCFSHSSTTERA